MEVDSDCLKLAKKFLEDSPHDGDSDKERELASVIQAAIEDWIEEN